MSEGQNKEEKIGSRNILDTVTKQVADRLMQIALTVVDEELKAIKSLAEQTESVHTKMELIETAARIKAYAVGQVFSKGTGTEEV